MTPLRQNKRLVVLQVVKWPWGQNLEWHKVCQVVACVEPLRRVKQDNWHVHPDASLRLAIEP